LLVLNSPVILFSVVLFRPSEPNFKNWPFYFNIGHLLWFTFVQCGAPSVVRLRTIEKNGRHKNQNGRFFRVFCAFNLKAQWILNLLKALKDSRSYIQYLPEVWKRAGQAFVKSWYSPRSQKVGFWRRVLKFFLK
jgi:hypothetical protein